jgi:hypothetical protein
MEQVKESKKGQRDGKDYDIVAVEKNISKRFIR